MRESWLHYLWKTKRFPLELKLVSGEALHIIHPGYNSSESGPDFFNAQIQIGGLIWSGAVEIHIKSSDWFAHQHQFDAAYSNVILHVVYEHDKEVEVQGEYLPVLELKTIITEEELSKFGRFFESKSTILCEYSFRNVSSILKMKQLESSVYLRFNRKAQKIAERYTELAGDVKQLKLEILVRQLFTKVNEIPAVELMQRVPLSVALRLNFSQRLALLFCVANVLPVNETTDVYVEALRKEGLYLQNKYGLSEMHRSSWKYFGVRPSAYPPLRIVILASLLENPQLFNWDEDGWSEWFLRLKLPLPDYWKHRSHFGRSKLSRTSNFSIATRQLFIINGFIPYFYWSSTRFSTSEVDEKWIDYLNRIPPEKNNVVEQFIKLGEKPKSAFETQGYLELLNEFCKNRKCLSCQIGTQLIEL